MQNELRDAQNEQLFIIRQYEHEIAILNLEHEHQLKLKDKELENKLSGDMMNTLISEAMKNPEIKRQFNQGVTDGLKKESCSCGEDTGNIQ